MPVSPENSAAPLDRRLSVAPMMDWTDRHERFFLRQITKRTLLYTEMITTGAILHGDRDRLLKYDPREHPVALQVGGADAEDLSKCAAIAAERGYDEINFNIGCPSDRVQSGRFGACLMAEPARVSDCVAAMGGHGLPVTVKCRIGIDGREDYEDLAGFVATVRQGGVSSFAIHARIAVLEGLSAKENREIPPLRYDDVYRLKADCPELEIVLNGGVLDLDQARAHLDRVDGVMIGRAAYQNPWMLACADHEVFGEPGPGPSPDEVIAVLADYAEAHISAGGRLSEVTRHVLGLFQAVPGARAWRRHLSENAPKPGAGLEVLFDAALKVPAEIRSARANGDAPEPRQSIPS
jgi:tRNA-dihydrouridine synthase A